MTTFKIAYSIEKLDPTHWDAVAGDQTAMTHRWQRVMEASRLHYRPLYALLQDERGPLAIVVANLAETFGRASWRGKLLQRLALAVRAPFSPMDCGLALRPGVTLTAALPQLEPALRALHRQAKRPFLLLCNVADDDLPAWRAQQFITSPQDPNTVLDLPANYDQYLETLTKKDRAELRRIHRRAATLHVRLEAGPIRGQQRQLYDLIRQVFIYHHMPPQSLQFTSELFAALEHEMAGDVVMFRGFVEGTLAGYLLCLLNGQSLWWLVAGLNYELARPSYMYFLLIDEMIRWSLNQDIQRIYGGLTNEREKQKHGFHLQTDWFCYRACSPWLNRALTLALPLARGLLGRASNPAAQADKADSSERVN